MADGDVRVSRIALGSYMRFPEWAHHAMSNQSAVKLPYPMYPDSMRPKTHTGVGR